jgi:Family of unknown function (DUF6788)
MSNLTVLELRRQRLIQQVVDHLDFLIGSISTKGFAYAAYNLTAKVDGKTRTRHIPKDMLPLVRRLTARYRKLKSLLRQLDEVNWQRLTKHGSIHDNGPL